MAVGKKFSAAYRGVGLSEWPEEANGQFVVGGRSKLRGSMSTSGVANLILDGRCDPREPTAHVGDTFIAVEIADNAAVG